ncbi:DNA damage-repair/toleration protein DRT100 [Heracleum sosnowskyi]|uniref:DNA damage-repair/toleration protein DRT100 n=1 Tax=Heracleum sosnowskyi TaxID=360622 RepID=A0AAD8JFH4_9APIA|nr:DNA damage-repair/toleration protein DRT100 [Heracleum sosnowskyi]
MTSLLFIAAILLGTASAVTSCTPSDRAALLAFKAALNEPYIGIFKSWTGSDCCRNWYGVSCDGDNARVTYINLRGESEDPIFRKANRTGYMTGTISPDICQLTWLSTIIIADWKGISGFIPDCISYLPHLRMLDLVGNKLTGQLPRHIGRLQRLKVLNVAENEISGWLPSSISNLSSLMHLDLRNNQISGALPRDIGKLRMMSRALLSRNQITGPIPNSISKIYRLSDLDLSFNQISGAIPRSLGKMRVLATLNLDNNKLSGKIPSTLINSGVSILTLSKNSLQGNIPDAFGQRSYFTELDLSYNQLKGPIPKSITSASYIGYLDLSHNHLCGQIPVGSPFDHLDASSFLNNDCLCGKPLKSC